MEIQNFELERESWMENGSCIYANSELFFPVGSSMKAIKKANEAKAVCNECFVKVDCLEYAVRTNQDSGFWGGATEEERKSIRREYKKNNSLLYF
jgi:WhiB family redox-sensing transcriptional regulator